MLTSAPLIDQLLRPPAPRHQSGATSTSPIAGASSRPTWCATPGSQPDTSKRGTSRDSRRRRPTINTPKALAR